MTIKEKKFKLFLKCVDLFQDDGKYQNEAYNLSKAQARWRQGNIWYVVKLLKEPMTNNFGVYLAVGKNDNLFMAKEVKSKNDCLQWLERFEATYNTAVFGKIKNESSN